MKTTKVNAKRLNEKLDKLLANPIPMSGGGGWAKASREDIEDLYVVLQLITDMKFSRDCDGDSTIEVHLIDRNVERHPRTIPLPYAHKPNDEDGFLAYREAVEFNFDVTWSEFQKVRDMERLRAKEKK
jgi:hypothetical protein